MTLCATLCICAAGTTHAEQSLGNAANDPTAAITSYMFQNYYTYNFHNDSDATANLLQFRSAIPFSTGDLNHIFRITIPYQTETVNGGSGWGDITIFDLVTFDREWGRFGVGAVALLPTGSSGLSAEKWGLGPAAGLVVNKSWGIWGLFNQNIFSVGGDNARPDVNISILQPILNYQLGDGWSVGPSEMLVTYDWENGDWASLPLGIGVNKLVPIGGNPWQFTVSYEHNFQDDGVRPADTVNFTAKLLVAKR
ncbi:hypothetical protein AVO45_18340 [Ruegeria marisrubri]|uniref:Neuromedin U n=1 Tax=Ruegeria marisrubri TaxID=1685379 RepID=A0A0X3UA87_9RHOB|nr:hypothetical protein AVO45_18340 [Ruegeria marisrubri]